MIESLAMSRRGVESSLRISLVVRRSRRVVDVADGVDRSSGVDRRLYHYHPRGVRRYVVVLYRRCR